MAKKKQEQQEQSQDEHVMAILDKKANVTRLRSRFQNERAGRQSRNRTTRQEEQQQLPKTGPYLTAGTVLHEFQEPVQQSHEFQFLPRTSRPFGKKTLNAVVQIRKGEDPGAEGKKLVEK